MAIETERKFLVRGDAWRAGASRRLYRQGYLARSGQCTVRVRIVDNAAAWLTIKGASQGCSREEFEYAIPLADAEALLRLAGGAVLDKWRYKTAWEGCIWEVDEFLGENRGLIVAEVELESEGQELSLPDWIGEEVTEDPRYYNAMLVTFPYSRWK